METAMEGVMGGWRRASAVNRTKALEGKGEKTTARSRRLDVLYNYRREMVAVVAMVLRRPQDQRPPRRATNRRRRGRWVRCWLLRARRRVGEGRQRTWDVVVENGGAEEGWEGAREVVDWWLTSAVRHEHHPRPR